MSQIPGQPRQRFSNHMEHAFVEFVRGRIHNRCANFPAYVYHVRQAELQYEEQARLEIAVCFAEEFPEAWQAPQVTKDWPRAICQINAERTSGRISVSWSPETDALRGGSPVDAIDFQVKRAPPNRGSRVSKVLRAMFGKTVVDPDVDIAPNGGGYPVKKPAPLSQSAALAPKSTTNSKASPVKPTPKFEAGKRS